jgi:FAD:protein FMN transferase
VTDSDRSTDALRRSEALMGTIVTIEVVGGEPSARHDAVERAFAWFGRVEACCSRFDPESELSRLSADAMSPVSVSPMLFEAVQFAIAVADASDGAFDPTVGRAMATRGFDRHYVTGSRVPIDENADAAVSYRDVCLDLHRRTIQFLRPLVLDLGAVAKGLAIDMAARELRPLRDFAIDAGGDLYLGGRNARRELWSVGIRHPRRDREFIETLQVSDAAVCTSGDYERQSDRGHHILDPRAAESATGAASVTVIASSAMVADALATAAFVLGPADGISFLERQGVDGIILTPSLDRYATAHR